MRRQRSRKKATSPSNIGLPEIEYTMNNTGKHLPSHPSPEQVDDFEKEDKAQFQEIANTKSLPGQPNLEEKGNELQLPEVSTKLSDNQDKFSPETKTPLKSVKNKKGFDRMQTKNLCYRRSFYHRTS